MANFRHLVVKARPNPLLQRSLAGVDTAAVESQLSSLYGDLMLVYPSEIARRGVQQATVDVHEVAGDGGPELPGGTLVVVTGDPADESFSAVVSAAATGSAGAVSDALAQLKQRRLESGSALSELDGTVADRLARVPVLARVSCDGKVVADVQLAGPGLVPSASFTAFAGGMLDPEAFSADFYVRDEGVPAESVVIYRQPELTEMERRVLAELPADQANGLIGDVNPAANWLVAAAVVGIVAAGVGAAYLLARAAQEAVRQQAAQDQQAQQDQGQQAQQDQGQGQGEQAQQDQGQQDQGQGQQDQGQQDQGQQDQQHNGGNIGSWLDQVDFATQVEGMDARIAVASLVQIRTQLLESRQIS